MLRRALRLKRPPKMDRPIMEIEANGRRVPVILRGSDRATRIGLRLGQKADAFILVVPHYADEREAIRFAQEHEGWMRARLAKLPHAVSFSPESVIPIRGEPHRLVPTGELRGLANAIEIEGEQQLHVPGLPEHFPRKVTDYLKAQARADLERSVSAYCDAIEENHRRISLRDPATRWGSCSSSGTLSFSWRLIMAPAYVLDYLAAHEVTHLRHMDHSRQFWRLLRDICPATDKAESWLKRHGRGLHAYGAPAASPAGVDQTAR